MKKRQFKYVLSFLILILLAFAALGNSQELTEETNPAEQSEADQLSEETNPTEQLAEDSNPTQSRPNTEEDSPETELQIFVIVVAFVILISAFVIFSGLYLVQKQAKELNDHLQGWDKPISQGNERIQKLKEMESNQATISDKLEKFHNIIPGIQSRLDNLDQTVKNLESEIETNITPDNTVFYQVDAESTILETEERLEEIKRAYRDGEPINLDYIETSIPSHNVVLTLNWIARAIREWITELEQSTAINQDLIQTLKYAEQTIKEKLKTIREESMPALKPLNLDTNVELDTIRDWSIAYPAQFEGVLIGYELGHQVDEAGSDQIIPQFIKDQLFNNVARHIPHDQLQEQLDKYLQLADYEVIPIEVGITEADSRFHEIQGSKHTGVKRGTVAEVVNPGLMQKTDRSIVQKPTVIRAE